MKKTKLERALSLFLCVVLITAMALTAGSCGKNETSEVSNEKGTSAESADAVTVGEGSTEFSFTVRIDGNDKKYTVRTDRKTVGDALMELGLIEGEEAEYGLFVKTVDGVLADFNVDKTYWAFYVDGEYAVSGVDTTDIVPGAEYMLSKEK